MRSVIPTISWLMVSPAWAQQAGWLGVRDGKIADIAVYKSADDLKIGARLIAEGKGAIVRQLAACVVPFGTNSIQVEHSVWGGYRRIAIVEGRYAGCRGYIAVEHFVMN